MERRKFTREFKLEAVRLIKERGVSYAQASLDLGVHQSQLRGWVKRFADDPQHAFPDDLPPLKWSSLKYVLILEDEINGEEAAYS